MIKHDEILADLDCLAAKARESGDESLSASLLMLRNNRKPGTQIRDELELAHRERHKALHAALDELAADWLTHNRDKRPSSSTVLELMQWSHEQTQQPTAIDDERKGTSRS